MITWDMVYLELCKISIVFLLVTLVVLFFLILEWFRWAVQRVLYGNEVDSWFTEFVYKVFNWWVNLIPLIFILTFLILILQWLGFFIK